jgi:hypothetical protein
MQLDPTYAYVGMLALLQVASQPMMKQKELAPARTRVTLQTVANRGGVGGADSMRMVHVAAQNYESQWFEKCMQQMRWLDRTRP